MELNSKVSLGPAQGKKLGNLIVEDAKFFGRPNFSGEENRFGDSRRQFNVRLPLDSFDQLAQMGWNVKKLIPTEEETAEGREELCFLKVMVDDSSNVLIHKGTGTPEPLGVPQFGIVDRLRIETMDMEIRAWEYKPDEKPGEFSARLVTIVANVVPNPLQEKYGIL